MKRLLIFCNNIASVSNLYYTWWCIYFIMNKIMMEIILSLCYQWTLEFLIPFFLTKVTENYIYSRIVIELTYTQARRYIFLSCFQIVCLLCSSWSFVVLLNFSFGSRLITRMRYRASPATLFDLRFLEASFSSSIFCYTHELINEVSESFQPDPLSLSRESDLVDSRGVGNVCSSRSSSIGAMRNSPFFSEAKAYRIAEEVRDAFSAEGNFSRVSSSV